MNDISMKNITEIAKKIGIEDNIELYGNYKAKINMKNYKQKGKLILVTAINPTPLGEGKTTVSISLSDAINSLGYNAIADLREPSMGPVFGIKGGATGGGRAQIVPMEDINLNFTGDIYAITQANNLLSSLIYNHIYFGNELKIDKILFNRCMDLNDRSLRNVKINIKDNIYDESYDITAASEVMAILSLSKDMEDLKYRLGEIIIGSSNGKLIKAKDINAQGAMASILKDAIKPNLVQTLEGNPAIVHTGPFANISIGCSSVISTNTSLSLSNYVITEAGFGADLGAEKFFDIKCRNNFNPSLVVLVATLKSLKYHGSCPIDYCMKENTYYLDKGLSNLYTHVENIKNVFNLNVVVAINKYDTDTMSELNYLCNKLEEKGIIYSITEGYSKGSKGSLDLAQKVINYSNSSSYKCAYDETDDIKTKIKKIATKVYRAKDVIYTNDSLEKISKIEQLGYNLPVCISKTQYSLSDDANNLSCDKDYVINVKDVKLKLGAGYIVVLTGSIFTMPGLPKIPNSNNIDIKNDKITGIF